MSNNETAEPHSFVRLLIERDLAGRISSDEPTGQTQESSSVERFIPVATLAAGAMVTIAWVGLLFWALAGAIRWGFDGWLL